MGTSDKSFNQVKNILGKLDRNIDQLRAQRLSPTPATAPFGVATQASSVPTNRAASPFGRATPMPPR